MKKLLYIIIISFALIGSCTSKSPVDDLLVRIDSLIEASETDSARRLLDSIDRKGVSAEIMARCALLTSKIDERSMPFVFNDSLLEVAIDFYRGRGDRLEWQSQYLYGKYFNFQKPIYDRDVNSCFIALRSAVDLANRLNDTIYLAKSYSAIASLYSIVNDFNKSTENYLLASRHYMDAGMIDKSVSSTSIAARQFCSLGQDSLALQLLLGIRGIVDSVSDRTALIEYNMAVSTLSLHFITRHEFVKSADDAIKQTARQRPQKSADNPQEIIIIGGKVENNRTHGNGKSAHDNQRQINDSVLDMIIERIAWPEDSFQRIDKSFRTHFLTNPYTKLVDQYYRTEIDNHILAEKSSRRHINFLIAAVAVLFVSVIAIYLLYSRRLQGKQLQILSLVNDIDRLRLASDAKLHPYSLINKLCELRQNAPSSDENHSIFGKNAARFVDNLNSKEVSDEIEQFVNSYRDNIMTKFREQFPQLTARQQQCMLLLFAGFSGKSIVAMLHYPSDGSFRTERSRIKHIIEQSSTPDRAIFLDVFQARNGL